MLQQKLAEPTRLHRRHGVLEFHRELSAVRKCIRPGAVVHGHDFTDTAALFKALFLHPGKTVKHQRRINGKLLCKVIHDICPLLHYAEGAAAARHCDAYTALVMNHGEAFDEADFAGPCDMRSAAGAHIGVRNRDDTDPAGEFLLAAVLDVFKFFLRWVSDFNRKVLVNTPVCLALDLHQLIPGERAGQINRDDIITHVVSDIFITVMRMNKPRDNVLAAVILHQVEPPRPVDLSMDRSTFRQRRIGIMNNHIIRPALNILYVNRKAVGVSVRRECAVLHGVFSIHLQNPAVRRLSPALRIKSSVIKNHFEAWAFRCMNRCTGNHLCIKFT